MLFCFTARAWGRGAGNGISVTVGKFKKWDYAPSSVFGVGKLEDPKKRYYYKISRVNDTLVKVERYNPAEVLVSKTMVYFSKGFLNTVKDFNQWGEEYSQTYFTKCGEGEFYVAKKTRGENSYQPCKKAKFMYKNDLLVAIRYYDDSGAVCTCSNGAALIRYNRYDDKSRFSSLKDVQYFDEDGAPAVSTITDCSKIVYLYDENGSELNEKYYGTNGLPVANQQGIYGLQFPKPILYNRYDEENLGDKGQVISDVLGVAITQTQYGEDGFLTMETRHNVKYAVTRTSPAGDGAAIVQFKHDAKGNETERSFYDENNKPLNNTRGYHKRTQAFSEKNMQVGLAYFDSAAAPVTDNTGVHRYSYENDSVGRTVTVKFFNWFDKPCKDRVDQVFEKKYRYDNYGRRISESYWNADGAPMNRWNGYQETRTKYNDDVRPVEFSYLDENGNYVQTSTGYSVQRLVYSNRGLVALRSYFNGDTAVMLNTRGSIGNYHAIKYGYDVSRQVISVEYLDTAGAPVNARVSLAENYACSKIEFGYQGGHLVQEKLYELSNNVPIATIDCLRQKYVNTAGVGTPNPGR